MADRLIDWSPAELHFLDRLHDKGVVDATPLTGDRILQERIRTQPMLLWKAHNVREYQGRKK